jgi:hypothetical protein
LEIVGVLLMTPVGSVPHGIDETELVKLFDAEYTLGIDHVVVQVLSSATQS